MIECKDQMNRNQHGALKKKQGHKTTKVKLSFLHHGYQALVHKDHSLQ